MRLLTYIQLMTVVDLIKIKMHVLQAQAVEKSAPNLQQA